MSDTNETQNCQKSQRKDGQHGWVFDGDDPYVICHWCKERRDAISGQVISESSSTKSNTYRECFHGCGSDECVSYHTKIIAEAERRKVVEIKKEIEKMKTKKKHHCPFHDCACAYEVNDETVDAILSLPCLKDE